MIGADLGSSPLTRGKLLSCLGVTPRPGLIPAHAGKTPHVRSGLADKRAHPRSRGENAGMRQPARPRSGSSPLTRGKPAALR